MISDGSLLKAAQMLLGVVVLGFLESGCGNAPITSNSQPTAVGANNPSPTISSLSPTRATAGSAAFTLTVNGNDFVSSSAINWNGTMLAASYINAGQITAQIPATTLASSGPVTVEVSNPAPGGGNSNTATFDISADNPLPAIASVSPAGVTAGGTAFTLSVSGSNFVAASVVNWNGTALVTRYTGDTELTAQVPAADIAVSGTAAVTVVSPTPGGGTSSDAVFDINSVNLVPAIASLSPARATAGDAAFTLTVSGSNFVAASVVNWNGTALVTRYVSDTALTAQVSATLVASTGTPSVTVVSPAPGGGTSNGATFRISSVNPVPAIASLSPASATAGGAAFTLTVNGSNFLSTSVVKWNGATLSTTYASTAKLTAQVSATLVASTGTPSVTVVSPAPGGGTSGAVTFTISSVNPVPTSSSISPANATAGGTAFTLTVNGGNFIATSVVKWNGAALPTTYVSASKLTAQVPAADISTVGTASLTIVNPTPGGGTSAALTFAINSVNPATPAISSLSPTSATAGGAAFTLMVNGSNFIGTSVVDWNGAALPTTFVSAAKLTAQVSAAWITATGTPSVTVVSPAGGGISNAATFTISSVMVGCGTSSPQTGIFNLTTTDGLRSRQFLMQVPADYSNTKAYALTFVFHGLNGNSSVSSAWGLQNSTGAAESSIFVFPNSFGAGWDDSHAGYDMTYFDNMVQQVETTYCIDSKRVFAAGFSWGGDFVTALIVTRGNVLRAVAVNSATYEFRNNSDYTSHIDYPYQTATHPAVRFEHVIGGDNFYPAPLFATTSKLFQHLNSCSSASTPYPSTTSSMTCASYNSCTNEVIECPFDSSLGHSLPPNWATDTWSFFAGFQ